MSANGEAGGREIAYRLFAAEYDDASLSHTESDEERAPNYVVTPTGARVNRVFVVGALTEVSQVNEEMVRARVVDPTGAFVVYAGQYQPDELAYLERADPPCFVAVTGKARTFEPEDGDRVFTSIRPESIATVDADTRDRWIVGTAEQTIDRIGAYASAAGIDARGEDLADSLLEAGLEEGLARGIPLAQDHYGTTPAYLEELADLATDAARVVAGERDHVASFDREPDESRPDAPTFADLAAASDLEVGAVGLEEPTAEATVSETETSSTAAETAESDDALERDEPEPAEAMVGDEPWFETADDPTTEADAEADVEAESDLLEQDETTDDLGEFGDATAADPGEFGDTTADDPDEFASTEDDDLEDVETSADEDDLGAFGTTEDEDDPNDLEGGEGMYQMDEDEREQIEEQFGAEFTTGSEVDDPGEADIDVPEADDLEVEPDEDDPALGFEASEDDLEEPAALEETEPVTESESESEFESDADVDEPEDEEDESEQADLEDVDLQEAAIETMTALDDGDGADRETVIARVVDETGASADDVEEAIQDALMGGRCYEPGDDKLKAI